MSQQYIIFNFLKSNFVLKVLFALIQVNKDLEVNSHLREKQERNCLVQFPWKKSLLFGSN